MRIGVIFVILCTAGLVLIGCVDRSNRCDELIQDPKFIARLFEIQGLDQLSIDNVCKGRPFTSYPLDAISDQAFARCPGVCSDEFVDYFSQVDFLSFLERDYCFEENEAMKDFQRSRLEVNIDKLLDAEKWLRTCLDEQMDSRLNPE
jgi:hypothetical protein